MDGIGGNSCRRALSGTSWSGPLWIACVLKDSKPFYPVRPSEKGPDAMGFFVLFLSLLYVRLPITRKCYYRSPRTIVAC